MRHLGGCGNMTNQLSLNSETSTAIVELHPEEKMALHKEWSDTLLRTIETTAGFVEMLGKNKYLKVEAWQMIAGFAGLAVATTTEPVREKGEIVGYKATARLVDIYTGEDRGATAEQQCRMDSDVQKGQYTVDKKHTAVMGMAQTRASSRVIRQKFGFVALLGGFQALTAEEITDEMRASSSPVVQHAKAQGATVVDVIPKTPAPVHEDQSLNSKSNGGSAKTTPDSSATLQHSSIEVSDEQFLCPLHDGEMQIKATNNKTGASYWGHKLSPSGYCNANNWDEETPKDEFIEAWSAQLEAELGHDRDIATQCANQPIKVWLQYMVNAKADDSLKEWCVVCGEEADSGEADDGSFYCIEHNPS